MRQQRGKIVTENGESVPQTAGSIVTRVSRYNDERKDADQRGFRGFLCHRNTKIRVFPRSSASLKKRWAALPITPGSIFIVWQEGRPC